MRLHLNHNVQIPRRSPPVLLDVAPQVLWQPAEARAQNGGGEYRAFWVDTFNTTLNNHADVAAVVANAKALEDEWKRTKLENIALLLRAAMEAHGRVGIMLNVRRDDLGKVLSLLPALQRPTISPLSDNEWVAINTIIEERTVRDLIPRLKAARAQGIVEYPLNKIVL